MIHCSFALNQLRSFNFIQLISGFSQLLIICNIFDKYLKVIKSELNFYIYLVFLKFLVQSRKACTNGPLHPLLLLRKHFFFALLYYFYHLLHHLRQPVSWLKGWQKSHDALAEVSSKIRIHGYITIYQLNLTNFFFNELCHFHNFFYKSHPEINWLKKSIIRGNALKMKR